MEPTAVDAAKTGLTVANCVKHIKENRLEYLVVSLLLYTLGVFEKGQEYVAGCV